MRYRITLTTDGQHHGEIIESENTEHILKGSYIFKPVYVEYLEGSRIKLINNNYIVEGIKIDD